MRIIKLAAIFLMLNLTACCTLECVAPRPRDIKPYGAHWIKEGMTRESRRADFVQCDGGADLREGYEVKSGQSNRDFFEGFNAHTKELLACMKSKNYVYLPECDERCMYP